MHCGGNSSRIREKSAAKIKKSAQKRNAATLSSSGLAEHNPSFSCVKHAELQASIYYRRGQLASPILQSVKTFKTNRFHDDSFSLCHSCPNLAKQRSGANFFVSGISAAMDRFRSISAEFGHELHEWASGGNTPGPL